jgi:predicted enzyme related to lactoylglutathione lyase
MSERTQYTPGTFSWTDLTTTDQEAAKAFYSGLFGWTAEDVPVGEGMTYSMMRVDGKSVAAISPQPQMMRDAGAPPTWNSYITVADVDATADKAKELGANVVSDPFDVMDAGRMAVLQDPQGAFFMLWQPKDNIGAELVNAPGALCWNELASTDLDASSAFYRDLFSWDVKQWEGTDQPYMAITNAEHANGGMRDVQPQEPPNWLVYFAVEDIDAGLAKVEELGGTKLAGPIDIQMAKIGIVQDPQGATFALYAGQLEP